MNAIKFLSVAASVVALSACGVCQTRETSSAAASTAACIETLQDDLESGLSKQIEAKQVSVDKIRGGALKVTVASDNNFGVGSASLNSQATALFAKVGKVVGKCSAATVHVVGHTDSTGSPEANQKLSDRRAAAVASVLGKNGVKASNIKKEGRGERDPAASNDTKEGKAANRRVDIVVSP